MKFEIESKWHCRNNGGLFLGIRYNFPVTICDDEHTNKVYQCVTLTFGMIFFSINISINYNYRNAQL